jgi:uncharacterized protein (TIGR02145 family)
MKELLIGSQIWSSQNLNTLHFRNGDPITMAESNEEWEKLGNNKKPACCFYKNESENKNQFGLIYNWYAINDPRGLAPNGWHIPSDKEWRTLSDLMGITTLDGEDPYAKGNISSLTLKNENGFSALLGGLRYEDGFFYGIDSDSQWWCLDESNNDEAWNRYINYFGAGMYRYSSNKSEGAYIRCVKK